MKEIKAFIRPEKLQAVYDALRSSGFLGVTISDCEGTGRFSDPEKDFPSLKYPFLHCRIVQLELLVTDENLEKAIALIRENAKTGSPGDGILSISEVKRVIRIRSGEEGPVVIH